MTKKWIMVVSIICVLVVSCILEGRYVNKTFDDMTENLHILAIKLESTQTNINIKENIDYLEFLHSDFHQKEKALKALIWHTGLKDVEISISKIISYTKENNFTEAITETQALIDYCAHYSQDFKISIENIF